LLHKMKPDIAEEFYEHVYYTILSHHCLTHTESSQLTGHKRTNDGSFKEIKCAFTIMSQLRQQTVFSPMQSGSINAQT
jgi:hypothetical protein